MFFSLAKGQPTQKSCFSHTSESLNVWVWELIYIVWLTVCMWFTYCSLLKDFPHWPTFPDLNIFCPVISILIHQFSLLTLCGPFRALGFVLSCPMGQDTLVNFHCFQFCMSKLTCWISHDSLMDLKIAILKTSLLSQQHVMMSVSYDMHQLYYTYNKYHGVLIQSVSK